MNLWVLLSLFIGWNLGKIISDEISLRKLKKTIVREWEQHIKFLNWPLERQLNAEREEFLVTLRELNEDIDRVNTTNNNI